MNVALAMSAAAPLSDTNGASARRRPARRTCEASKLAFPLTSPSDYQRIASEVDVIVKEPDVIAEFDKIGAEAPAEGSPDYFARILKEEADRVARAIATARITPQ